MAKIIGIRQREEMCFFDTCMLDSHCVEFFKSRETDASNNNWSYNWNTDDIKVIMVKEFHIPRIQQRKVSRSEASNFFETTTYEDSINNSRLTKNSILSTWPEVNLALNLDGRFSDPAQALEVYGKFVEGHPEKVKDVIQLYESLLSPIHKVKWRLAKPLLIPVKAELTARLTLAETRPFYGRLVFRGMLTRDVT